jgi:phosphatidylglycerol---prolipoprotein diacylglyceryl transferase
MSQAKKRKKTGATARPPRPGQASGTGAASASPSGADEPASAPEAAGGADRAAAPRGGTAAGVPAGLQRQAAQADRRNSAAGRRAPGQPAAPASTGARPRLTPEAEASLAAQAGLVAAPPAAPAGPVQTATRPSRPVAEAPSPKEKAAADKAPADKAADSEPDDDEDVPEWAAQALEQMLHVICWLDPGETGERYTATVRFTGQRTGVTGRPGPADTFTQDETFAGIMPGSGPVALTAEVHGINKGTWAVTARLLPGTTGTAQPRLAAAGRVPLPRRIAVPDGPAAMLATATKLRSKVPGIIRYAYAPLCVLGVLVGLILEALLLSNAHYPLLRPVGFSIAAVAAGVAGGKAWFGAVHQWRKWDGWCIQGFVAGAAIVVGIVAAVGPGLPPGAFLAAATPALLIGMGIGRHACFFAGCCTGRPTAWRWGIWSSDRRLGCRRMPVQLYEAWTALVLGAGALATVLAHGLARSGPVAVVALAAYTLVRQGILGLRDEPRAWRYGRPVTATLAALAVIAGVVLFAL